MMSAVNRRPIGGAYFRKRACRIQVGLVDPTVHRTRSKLPLPGGALHSRGQATKTRGQNPAKVLVRPAKLLLCPARWSPLLNYLSWIVREPARAHSERESPWLPAFHPSR